jgi:hypothetical protein
VGGQPRCIFPGDIKTWLRLRVGSNPNWITVEGEIHRIHNFKPLSTEEFSMSKTFRVISNSLIAALLTVGGAVHLGLAHNTKATARKTFVGRVVDLACYTGHGSIGDSHRECATSCAKAGVPLAILDQQSQTLYLPLSKNHHAPANTELMPFVERDIRVTGTVAKKNGLKTILLESIEAAK